MQLAQTKYGPVEYRDVGQGPRVALLLLGGHVNASAQLGEDYFVERGYRVLIVSRPGYGKTPLQTGTTPDGFAKVLYELVTQLHISQAVVVGISAGGRTAIRFAAKYPALVSKLILQSAVSFAPWPDRLTQIGTYLGFNPVTEKYTWTLMRALAHQQPTLALEIMLGSLSTLNPAAVVKALSESDKQAFLHLITQMRSGSGFVNDIQKSDNDATDVTVPTLIIHSQYDKSVPLSHPRLLAQQIPNAQLYLSDVESHMLWFSPHYPKIKQVMDQFLATQDPL